MNHSKQTLLQLLDLRKDKRYRAGLLQAAVSFGVISHQEWITLGDRYIRRPVHSGR